MAVSEVAEYDSITAECLDGIAEKLGTLNKEERLELLVKMCMGFGIPIRCGLEEV